MKTSAPSQQNDLPGMEFPSTPSVAASHVKTCHGQTVFGVAALGWKARVRVYGQSTPDSFANYDPASQSWKTCQTFLLASELFSATWPRAGMMRNGIAYKRPSLGAAAPEIGSGWFRTPVASDWTGSTGKGSRRGTLAESLMISPGPNHVPLRGKTGFPNPPFLEWLMGLPIGWTASGGPKASEMPSSHRSPKSLGDQS